jgi:hypothetical protein
MNDSPDEQQLRPEDDPEIAALLNFKPAPRQKRGNGWTPALQKKFIAHLALTGSPELASEAVGKNRHGVQKVYRDNRAGEFRGAWDAAVALFEQREADRIEREQAGLVGVTPPFVDRRRKRSTTPPLDGERKGWGASDNHHPHPTSPIEGVEFQKTPVICDKCAAEGAAGDEAFADIPYLLAFDPVPRPAHDRLWDAPTQRAFVAALAVTGSIERAARSIKRHGFAVEKLRKSRGAREFNEACEAALDVARQRELAKMGGRLSELGSEGGARAEDEGYDPNHIEEVRQRLFNKLQKLRKRELLKHKDDPKWRAAWEVINGPEEFEQIEKEETANLEAKRAEEQAAASVEPDEAEDEPSPPQHHGPSIYNLNSPEAYEVLCPRDSRPWIPNGALPKEKRPDRGAPVQVTALPSAGETGVPAEADNEEAAKEAFKEWQDHVDAGRLGKKADS